jgi:hypothetical protein
MTRRLAAMLILVLATCRVPVLGDEAVTVDSVDQLRRAVAGAKPGTTVLIAPGTYEGGLSARGLRGEPGSPITIRAADPRRPPVFRGG